MAGVPEQLKLFHKRPEEMVDLPETRLGWPRNDSKEEHFLNLVMLSWWQVQADQGDGAKRVMFTKV